MQKGVIYKLCLLAIFIIVWIWAAINPVYPEDWLLENYLVFVFVPIILITAFYFKLSNLSYTLITIFMCLHVIGSHYTYAEVPFGETLQVWLGADRNMYDRLVHFTFGLLLAYPVREMFSRVAKTKGIWSFWLPVELTLAFSAIYELFEWGSAVVVNPEAGLAFLGAQGDIWDAQKDMALAGLGSLVTMAIVFITNLAMNKDFKSELKESFSIPKADRAPWGEEKIAKFLKARK